MLAKVTSAAAVGLDALPVKVEVNIEKRGFPAFTIVGLPDKAVEESRERVRSAIVNTKADFPNYRLTVNLAPADLKKAGSYYDLPIALGILIASGQLEASLDDTLVLGELSLDGSLHHTPGVLPAALLARGKGIRKVFLPAPNAAEASIVRGIDVYPVATLFDLMQHLLGLKPIDPVEHVKVDTLIEAEESKVDFEDILGQEHAKRALEIAAAGGHNLRLSGPPGAGKTLLARALPSIMPRMTSDEALEITKIYSITGNLPPGEALVKTRSFRSPHHTTSRIGLIGGGTRPQPGEISMAHRGVLFLDEFPEFPRHVLEALRQPLEDGVVTVSRAAGSLTFPAKFLLVTAENPCPCGYLGDSRKSCTCTAHQISRYKKRVSGPILDRIDLHVEVPAVATKKLMRGTEGQKPEGSKEVRGRVQKARDVQTRRYEGKRIFSNAELSSRDIPKFCGVTKEAETLLRQAVSQMALSVRAYHKVLKVSQTIADLAGAERILPEHVAEALQYRPRESEF
ncbi:MAG: YifB family Mg chelatase-like AAA ATPase [Patescibacteria group bacterium]|nr:MAG: YifB family Mg chelatase-like AAA ATPase [Patescibacteria group bacterium]